jgi:hypothetical protein
MGSPETNVIEKFGFLRSTEKFDNYSVATHMHVSHHENHPLETPPMVMLGQGSAE